MKPEITLTHEFVETIPDNLQDRKLYVSIRFSTVVHKCACGCQSEVVTPIHPTKWQLTFDGKSISLYPSVGSWNLPCRSHYWIKRNKVIWARSWSKAQVEEKGKRDDSITSRYFQKHVASAKDKETPPSKE